MNPRSIPSLSLLTLACAAAMALMVLGACGGDPGDPGDAAAAPEAAAPRVVAPLLDDDGSFAATAARAQPADAAAWTREGRYATEAQARQLAEALGASALQVEVECCGGDAVDRAVGMVWGLQAADDLPASTPVLVRSADLRLAAAAANRLASGGLTHVWLVTP